MLTMDSALPITPEVVGKFIRKHNEQLTTLDRLYCYYRGEHDILMRHKPNGLSNNRLVCNHAKYITDTVVGYFAGTPVTYAHNSDHLSEWLKLADVQTEDVDLALKSSIFGRAYELVYMSDSDITSPFVASIDPRNAFVVYDDTVEHKPIFGVHFYTDGSTPPKTKGEIYSNDYTQAFEFTGGVKLIDEPKANIFGMVNLIEIYNNDILQGDFEQVISLIDAYNLLQSDRVNDKEQFVSAILLIKGQMLGVSKEEESEVYQSLRKFGLLNLDVDSSAEWLTRQFDESSVELLKRALEQDIHKFANVPSMSDEQFAGNASGVAMSYKLLGFEQLVKIKERYFKEGLRYRLKLFCSALKLKHGETVNPLDIGIKFTRSLPVDNIEKAQLVQALEGLLPTEVLLSLLPFIDDPKAVAQKLEAEKTRKLAEQQAVFNNMPLVDYDEKQ